MTFIYLFVYLEALELGSLLRQREKKYKTDKTHNEARCRGRVRVREKEIEDQKESIEMGILDIV